MSADAASYPQEKHSKTSVDSRPHHLSNMQVKAVHQGTLQGIILIQPINPTLDYTSSNWSSTTNNAHETPASPHSEETCLALTNSTHSAGVLSSVPQLECSKCNYTRERIVAAVSTSQPTQTVRKRNEASCHYILGALALLAGAGSAARATGLRALLLHGLGYIRDRNRATPAALTASAGARLRATAVSPLDALPINDGGHCE